MAKPVERPTPEEGGQPFVQRRDFKGEIEFRNVRFKYPGRDDAALDGVSFRITPGERVALIGRVGSAGLRTFDELGQVFGGHGLSMRTSQRPSDCSRTTVGAAALLPHRCAVGCRAGQHPFVDDERRVAGDEHLHGVGDDRRLDGQQLVERVARMALRPRTISPGCGSKTADGSYNVTRPSRSAALRRSAKQRIRPCGVD